MNIAFFVFLKALIFFVFLSPTKLLSQNIALNEIMASNATTISDEDGDFEDWIEIYNYGDKPVALEGYGLSDDYDDPFRWIFPENVTIQPGDYLLIWASGKDRSDPANALHTNYSISREGEEVILTSPDSVLIDEHPPTHIPGDISYGRKPDGTGNWYYFNQPTPGESNATESFSDILPPPLFSSPGGFYNQEFELTIFHPDEDVTIIYTIDGSEPSIKNLNGSTYRYKKQYRQYQHEEDGDLIEREYISREYLKPVMVEDKTGKENTQTEINTLWEQEPVYPREDPLRGTVVRAKAYKDGFLSSEIVSNTYIIKDSPYPVSVVSLIMPEKSFFSYEEGIYVPGKTFDDWRSDNFHTNIGGSSPANFNNRGIEWERETNFELFDHTGNTKLNHRAGVRIHGGWSRSFPQKSLRMYAKGRYGKTEFEHQLFQTKDTDVFKRFMMRNSGNDHNLTFFRDALMQQMIKDRQIDMQHCEPVVTFLNGEYWGILNIRDRFDKYYLHHKHGVNPDSLDILEGNAQIKEGDNRHYNEMMDYVEENDLSDSTHYDHVKTMMDIENFAEYYAIQIYVRNTDWPGNNIDFWRYRTDEYKPDAPYGHDGRWRWLLYDLDFGFGIWGNTPDHNTLEFASEDDGPNWPNPPWSTSLFRNLLDNEDFGSKMVNRLADLMNEPYQPDSVIKKIDEMQTRYEPIIREHINRWTQIGSIDRWNDQIDVMRNFARVRPGYMKSHIEDFFELDGNYELTINIGSGQGIIKINTLTIENPDEWKGTYFNDVAIEIEAIETQGYEFSHWEGSSNSTSNAITVNANEDIELIAYFNEIESPELMNFWVFDSSMPNNTPLESLEDTYHILNQAEIIFKSALEGYPFYNGHDNWRKASMERRNAPTDINYRAEGNDGISYEDVNMRGLQIKQPFLGDAGENEMIFHLPTIGYENIVFHLAAKDEGAADALIIDYSLEEGNESWITSGLDQTTLGLTGEFQLYEVDFTEVDSVDDNINFKIRIRFDGVDMAADNGNRVTFNNISLEGNPTDEIIQPPQLINPPSLKKAIEKGDKIEINLYHAFEDTESAPITFDVKSSRPEIAEANIDGNMLKLIPHKRGDAEITIIANDGINPDVEHSFNVLVYPEAFKLSEGNFKFSYWGEEHPELRYPENMLFLQSDTDDPGLSYPLLYAYHIEHDDYHADDFETIGYPYNNTGRTRVNGLADDGISFINTGRGRDLGGALLAINTTGKDHINLRWTAGTILQNNRIYAIRLQYRIGKEGEFSDLIYYKQVSQYLTKKGGHSMQLPTIKLPEKLMNQEYVQLLWRYYHIGIDSGSRAQLRLDDILIGEGFASDNAYINSFEFEEEAPESMVIDDELFEISAIMPHDVDISSLTPVISISDRSRIRPSPNDDGSYETMDFNEPIEYTVTSESGLVVNNYIVTIDNLVSVKDRNRENIMVFPNPAFNEITISAGEKIKRIDLIDVTGNLLYTHSEQNSDITIPIDDYMTGMYFLQIHTNDNVFVKKIQIIN